MAGKNKLVVETRGDKEIVMTRVFDAPRHLVFECMTKPEHVKRWWGCMDGHSVSVCEIDFRVGGKWRYVLLTEADGTENGFSGEYLEIDAPKKVVQTEIYDPFPTEAATCTMTLDERDGKTYFQNVIVHTSTQGRDAHVSSGMEYGAGLGFDRVEEIAQSMVPNGGSTAASPSARA